MLYGVSLSAHGANNQSRRLDVIANNLANAGTTGFKRDLIAFRAQPQRDVYNPGLPQTPEELRDASGGSSVGDIVTDFTTGPQLRTDQPLDLALQGDGFAKVRKDGEEFLTRDLKLTKNSANELVMQSQGLPVLSTGGTPIVIPADTTDVLVSGDGMISAKRAGGVLTQLEQLDLVQTDNPQSLVKAGGNLYQANGPLRPADRLQVRQGFIEASGVQPMREMNELIQASRMFEANVNMIKQQDETLGMLLQSIPRR